jgi:hypothetical protein
LLINEFISYFRATRESLSLLLQEIFIFENNLKQ